MRGAEAEGEAPRGRPLSGGLWTLFSWLRRDDRSSSSDSLSSAGSDRTAASFAYLAPPPLRNRASPLPPLAPPTDSYRKRVHDGNLRKQYDRNLTIHRKYGLYYGYDAFSLPSARKLSSDVDNEQERERRANSESLPRRAAFVPGKRRAPLPPSRPHSVISTASLTRRHNRKRPAPLPPVRFIHKSNENISPSGIEKFDKLVQMNSHTNREFRSDDSRSEKHSKKESNLKETKIQKEKSFLKQIFENKKRNSAIESVPERILPNISELDKQAAEIIESRKLKLLEHHNNSSNALLTTRLETWVCTRCLRRYDSTVVTCEYCLPKQKRSSALIQDNFYRSGTPAVAKGNNFTQTEKDEGTNFTTTNRISGIGAEEKQKLKEMLKEMKDSLPKKSKRGDNEQTPKKNVFTFDPTSNNSSSLETPTLRIESNSLEEDNKRFTNSQPSTSKQTDTITGNNITEITNMEKILPQIKSESVTNNVMITQHVVLVAPDKRERSMLNITKNDNSVESISSKLSLKDANKANENNTGSNNDVKNLHTPLRISSLLNPVYIPKHYVQEPRPRNLFFSKNKVLTKHVNSTTADATQSDAITTSSNVSSSGTSQLTSLLTTAEPKENTTTEVDTKLMIARNKFPPKSEQSVTNTGETIKTNEIVSALVSTATSFPSASSSADTSTDKINHIQSNMTKFTVDQHSRRRDLINQLEQSIAKGDERAASDAAVKLAQLRLSCSVLSFSSQIMAQSPGRVPQRFKAQDTFSVNKSEETKIENNQSSEGNTAVQFNANGMENKQTNEGNTAVQPNANGPTNILMKGKCLVKDVVKPEKKSAEVQTKATSKNKTLSNENKEQCKQNLLLAEPSTSKQISNEKGSNLVTIQVWVEDREATRGPVRLRIPREAVMGDLRRQAEHSLGLIGTLQRWIVGRALCTDDRTPLISLAGPDLLAPFYLCVVETESGGAANKIEDATTKNIDKKNASDVYSELVQLEQQSLVVNTESFECGICLEDCPAGGGAVLRECVHMFCRECLSDLIKHCEEPVVSCPAMGCRGVLQEREIRSLVTLEEYERWLARGLAAAESGTRNAFHCRTRDCTGWALCDPGVRRFPCPVCKHKNCIPCQAIHEGETCDQYRKKLQQATSNTAKPADEGTQALLETLITKGEALECPECRAIITKKWGCDWVKCSACKTEICWVTRGRRWGPAGKGDTSGGCRCGVDGKRCHPSCGYCH